MRPKEYIVFVTPKIRFKKKIRKKRRVRETRKKSKEQERLDIYIDVWRKGRSAKRKKRRETEKKKIKSIERT